MNILFRADSSSTIGTGHIMRDLVLAQQYKKSKITFAVQDLNGNINYKINESKYEIKIIKSNNIDELDELIKELDIDMIVFDHYGIDYTYEQELKNRNPTLKIFSFDDTYETHYCNILLNHNMNATKKKYKGKVPKDCELRCGSKYTLLRDEFIKEKKKKRKKYFNYTIFVAMGGADHSNINVKILKVLKKFKNLNVNIVTTTANKNLNALQKYSKNKNWINLHINSNKIAKLIHKSDFAIVTPSVSANEVHYMQIPFIAIKTANNQNELFKYLKKKQFRVMKSFKKKLLYDTILNAIKRRKIKNAR